ncbi:MAG: hypothetical protein M1819_006671 [Sarea resinae]|nr:MAG: hypothetical protein M1819_006671 [Sarea resinae]
MPSLDEPTSPPGTNSTPEEELAYYKSQYEQMEVELAEFQASSRELEAELERDVEASEKRERKLQEKLEGLGFEVDEWKTKYKQSKTESNAAQNALQKEITTLRDTTRTLQLKLRDIEVANDDFERQARNTSSSLEDLESKYNVAFERNVLLEEEIMVGEKEREALRIETQRLRDELSDLKIEAEITQEKLKHVEAAAERQNIGNTHLASSNGHAPHSPILESSPATTTSSPTMSTPPPPESGSSTVSEMPTPPSPPISESSVTATSKTAPSLPKRRLPAVDPNVTPRLSHFASRTQIQSKLPSAPSSNGWPPSSVSRIGSTARAQMNDAPGLPHSGSLHQIRGLIGKMQKLEQRVHSARSKLPAPVNTPPGASPRSGSALGNNFIPSTVTVRSNRKRASGSTASAASSMRDAGESIPLSTNHVNRVSFGGFHPSDKSADSRPNSRASVSSRSSTSQYARPSSRASLTGTRTPLGHYSTSSVAESRRPRSSVGGHYSSLHGHGQSASVSETTEKEDFSTPTPRRSTLTKNDLAQGSGIPTPSGLPRRRSGPLVSGLAKPVGSRLASIGTGDDGERDTTPRESRRKMSGIGETY